MEKTSSDFRLPKPTLELSVELVEFWLERQTIKEAFVGECEDAAAFGESGELQVCSNWIAEKGNEFCERQNMEHLDAKNPYQDFSAIKSNGFWWCRKSCDLCKEQE